MSRNQISDEGAIAIAELLKANPSLSTLSLASNTLSPKAIIILIKALETNTHLTTLDLSYNKIDINTEVAEAIVKLQEKNSNLIVKLDGVGHASENQSVTSSPSNKAPQRKNPSVTGQVSHEIPKTKFFLQTYKKQAKTKGFSGSWNKEFDLDTADIGFGETLTNLLGLHNTQPILVNGHENEAALSSRLDQIFLDKQQTLVVYFPISPEITRENVKRKAHELLNLGTISSDKVITFHVVASELPFETFAGKVSDNFAEASILVSKNENVSVLKAEKSPRFPWGKLALLLLVLGLGGVIGLAVVGLFLSFWVTIPTAVFLIGVGIGIKALYDTYQQRQRTYQKSLLTPGNKQDTFMGQDEDQLLLSQNQLENSYQTKKIKAEKASAKLTEILKNKGLDFKKAEAMINVLGYDNGDFYLTYKSLTSFWADVYGSDEEGKAEFQKGWELVEALVIDNPSQRKLPYKNCIVIEVDTILNMGLKNNEGSSVERKEGREVSVDDSLLSVTSAQNIRPKFFSEMVKVSQVNASDIEEVQKAKRAKEIIIQKLNEFVSSHQTKKLIIKYQNANFEFTPEEIQECFANMETKLDIVQEQSTGDCMLQWKINTPNDKRRELIEKQFHRMKKQAGEVFSNPATMIGTFDMDRRQSLLVKLAITHCIGENIAVKHPDIRYPNSVIILSPSIEKIIRQNSDPNESLTLKV